MRDNMKSEIYWKAFIEDAEMRLGKFLEALEQGDRAPRDIMRVTAGALRYAQRITIGKFSAGAPVDEMRAPFKLYLSVLERRLEAGLVEPDYFRAEYAGAYDRYMRDLALCYLLKLGPDAARPLQVSIDFFEYEDEIFETLLHNIGFPHRRSTKALVWLEAYSQLQRALRSKDPENAIGLRDFVEGWYNAMEDTAWHDSHLSDKNVYYGYWCFEAAAIASIRQIDVTSVRGHPHFPVDFLIY